MTDEKVLAFLNLRTDGKEDKSLPKITIWYDVGVAIATGAALLLHTPLSQTHIAAIISFVVTDVLLFIWLALYKNPVRQFNLAFAAMLATIIKLFYGYAEIALEEKNDGIPMFTWIHLAVLIVILFMAFCVIRKMYRAYRFTKENSIEEATEKIRKDNPVPKWAIVVGAIGASPMILVRLFKDDLQSLGLGGGFLFWAMGCIWVFMLIISLPKCIVSKRFHAAEIYERLSKQAELDSNAPRKKSKKKT